MEGLRSLPDASVHCCLTSPPYYALRNYGIPPQTWADGVTCVLGEEPTMQGFIVHLTEVFEEVKRVLHPSGTLWINMGDSYQHAGPQPSTGIHARNGVPLPSSFKRTKTFRSKKQLGMVPARMAIALQDKEWIVRQHIAWVKGCSFLSSFSGSVMPESIQDRPIWAWESVYMLSKQDKYYYDKDGNLEPYAESTRAEAGKAYKGQARKDYEAAGAQNPSDVKRRVLESVTQGGGRNLRNVWVIPKEPFSGGHFATWPSKLCSTIIGVGASRKGCCPSCLAPWERVTHKEEVPAHIQAQFEASRLFTTQDTGRTDGYTARKPNYRRRILGEGWRPTCTCEAGDPIPCTILDPFSGGSGRTAIQAHKLGADFIGIEVNPEYVAMATALIQEATGARDQAQENERGLSGGEVEESLARGYGHGV